MGWERERYSWDAAAGTWRSRPSTPTCGGGEADGATCHPGRRTDVQVMLTRVAGPSVKGQTRRPPDPRRRSPRVLAKQFESVFKKAESR